MPSDAKKILENILAIKRINYYRIGLSGLRKLVFLVNYFITTVLMDVMHKKASNLKGRRIGTKIKDTTQYTMNLIPTLGFTGEKGFFILISEINYYLTNIIYYNCFFVVNILICKMCVDCLCGNL